MNLEKIDELTPGLVGRGCRVFQAHRFAESDFAHVSRLERWAELPLYSKVIDMGCGVGEVARIFNRLRPDLTFCLVNLSQVQLGYADPMHRRHCCDYCNVPEPDGSFDAAFFLFSIGHEAARPALSETARLLRVGGVLFIYDMVRVSGDNETMRGLIEYEVNSRQAMEAAAQKCGFVSDFYMEPFDDGSYGSSLFGTEFDRFFSGTIPAIWRFVKA